MYRMIENLRNLTQFLLFVFFLFASQLAAAQVTADFTSNTTSGCSPLIVNFQNLSTGTGLSYSWSLGNGNTSVSENPSASYVNPGTYTVTLTATGPGGTDTETKTAYITVFTPPVPDLAPSQNIGCYPFTVDFTDLSVVGDSPIATWSWDFGDGGTSTDQNPSHQYTTPGVFDITLILTDANGCTSNQSFSDMIESNNNTPTAAFAGDPTVSCLPPADVAFSNTSSGGTGVLTYEWTFGDGNTSTDAAPDNTYNTSGNFDVSLTVTDEYGCSDTQFEPGYIEIVDNVTIDFAANNTTVCLGENASFTDLSSPTPVSWEWDFGDGNTSTNQSPTHLYTTPGTYEVALTATYSASCQGTETKTAYITVGEIPFVNFTADTVSGCETPFPVQFTNGSFGGGLTYQWNFGDGSTSTDENATHTYTDNGIYTVSLTATNADGCSSTQTSTDLINIAETRADFLPDVFGFCQPLEVNFTDTSVSGTNINSYEWNFGDGGTSSLQNPTYTYQDTGIFDVSLVITNELGCTDTLTRSNYIFVYTPPVANFVHGDTVICPGELDFTDLSENATDWFWDFGDTELSTEQNPTHEYADTGYFSVTLITLNNGCSDTLVVEDMIYVSPPIADLEYSFDCLNPNEFVFSNESYGFTSWNWILPDGSTSTDDPLVLNIPNPGEYIVRVTTANDTSGCVDTAGDTIHVAVVEADFSAANTEGCGPLDVEFTNESTDAISYEWFFGSGDQSSQENPNYVYSDIGTYSVTYVATDINGCTDTIVEPNLVTVTGSIVNFGIDTTFGCSTLSVQFADLTDPPGTVASWLWDFGDGNTSTDENPLHIYQDAGTYDVSLTITDIGGCTNTIEQPDAVVYIPYPNPVFTVNQTAGCIGDLFTFTNNSTGNAVNYQWNFGDGGTSTDANPTHSYSAEGTYSVTLTAFNSNGCDSSITQIGLIDIDHPEADFTAFPTFAFCPPLLVSFTDASTADAVSWFWNFGDGSSSNLQNPSHIYTESGVFSVYLVVTNANGCTDTIFEPELIELSGPSGEFTFFPDSVGCPPYDITFTSIAENVTNYTWDFGDGFLGSGASTSHTYTEIGSFIPTLILEDDNGCTFIYQSADTLDIAPLPVDAGLSGTICQFDSLQLNASGGDGYSWSPATGLDNPNSASPYASPDQTTQYVVTVSAGLCQNTDTLTVFVNPAPAVNFDATEVCFGTPTQFSDLTTIAAPDNITSWNWDLDEGVSTDTNPSITYSSAGTYNISLTVESSSACSSTGTGTVIVNPSPVAAFTANDTCLMGPTFLSDQSSVNIGSITDWNWDLGNGATSTQQNPSLTYAEDSIYQVTLVVTAAGGCTDTVSHPVEVAILAVDAGLSGTICQYDSLQLNATGGTAFSWSPPTGLDDPTVAMPYASPNQTTEYVVTVNLGLCQNTDTVTVFVNPAPEVSFVGTEVCFGTPTQFSDFSSIAAPDSITAWNWDLGQSLSTDTNPSITYAAPGTYDITLTAESSVACTTTGTGTVTVNPTPVAAFAANDTCLFTTTSFTDLSTVSSGSIVNWNWDLGNGSTSLQQNPSLTYAQDSVYQVTLAVTASEGCTDTITLPVEVFPLPNVSVTAANVCLNEAVQFGDSTSINSGSIAQWDWTFGDGNTSAIQHPSHVYTASQTYVYSLTAVSNHGCTGSAASTVTVNPLPVSDFQMTSTSSCFAPVSVNLFNQSTGANQFAWTHDNGNVATSFNSTAIFDSVGQYNIQLLVTTQFGCQDSSTQLFEVFPTVTAGFDFSTPMGCEPWDVAFTNTSENGTAYTWNFNDGDYSDLENPDHTFFDPGTYTVQLIVDGLGGCGDTLTINNLVTVWPNPTAQFEYSNVQAEIANGTVAFFNTSTPHVSDWWDFGDGETDLSLNTTHQYDIFGNKLVTLAIVDANGCVDTAQMYISVDFFGGLYVPNAMIPQDPNSDVRIFQPKGTGLARYECMVYDKWGNLLWQSNKLEQGSPSEYWDGTHQGELVPQGSYVWKINAIFGNGDIWDGMENREEEYHDVGTVTVIR